MDVSVVITNHNYGRYVGEAIESARHQTQPPTEVVVVDDGSSDGSRSVLERYASLDNIHVLFTENHGVASATNAAIDRCTGDVVCLLDADDIMQPARVETVADAFRDNQAAQWVAHAMLRVDRSTLRPLPDNGRPACSPGRYDVRDRVHRGRLPLQLPATSALAWRLPFLRTILPIPERVVSQDNFLKFASMALAPGLVLGDVLSLQGIHADNRYSTGAGAVLREQRARNAAAMLPGFESHGPDLIAVSERIGAWALVHSRLGRRLPAPYLDDLRGWLRRRSPAQLARIGAYAALAAAEGLALHVRERGVRA